MWSTIGNEEIFKLPRPLKNDDIISIRGNMTENKDNLIFNLKTGIPSQNNQDFAIQMKIDFIEDIITLVTNNSGPRDPESQRPSRILNSSDFKLKLQIRNYEDSILIDIAIGDYSLDSLELDRNTLDNITFFTISNVIKVEELTFTYV
ncbi:uncharacterized protein LOC126769045 isoform X2 [Nymphalis io]|nr:uncharacterized protein LOC126769045 isoform X2 [Nymphalis io]XP_050343549.1 uncharacterized protein LOC126769045 isoform X2 [Nymphalis io]XP_050343550.1 uncharacterized protein LOC126769045 isoform X2 [Nymphalis io]XP_050343551.1 uncharacterized protein LOC126769045 isoform X2 [Nymphalis io]